MTLEGYEETLYPHQCLWSPVLLTHLWECSSPLTMVVNAFTMPSSQVMEDTTHPNLFLLWLQPHELLQSCDSFSLSYMKLNTHTASAQPVLGHPNVFYSLINLQCLANGKAEPSPAFVINTQSISVRCDLCLDESILSSRPLFEGFTVALGKHTSVKAITDVL